jgi:hypothetical protein
MDRTDFQSRLNDLWRSTVDQLEDIKDAVVRTTEVGRAKLDAALLRRDRDRLYARLGESAYKLAEAGALALPADLEDLRGEIGALNERIAAEAARAESAGDAEADDDDAPATAPRKKGKKKKKL